MLPFFQIGPVTIYSYGMMIVVGLLCGALLIWLRARKTKLPSQDALFAYLYGIIGLAIGAKLFYLVQALPQLIEHVDDLRASPELLLDLLASGFVFYGGLFGGIAGAIIYAKQFHISFRSIVEVLTPVIPLVHGFGRIGCFLAGCCYGIPYDGPLCVVFETPGVAPLHTPLFPVQLMESALLFILVAFLLLYDRYARHPRSLMGWYLLLYGVIRMITEVFRGDEIRGSFLIFSTSQWISIAIILVGIVVLIKLKGSEKPEKPEIPETPEKPDSTPL